MSVAVRPKIRVPARTTPVAGITRGELRALGRFAALYVGGGGYSGARSDKASLRNWHTWPGSADGDTLGDLPTLRGRSRDLGRNNPLAAGAISTLTTNVIGTGLWPCAAPNAELLGISEAEAEAFGRRAELLFNVWADSEFCDAARSTNFAGLQEIAFRGVIESGDHFVLRRQIPRKGAIVGLALQLIEADRVANPPTVPETERVAAGIEVDADGAPVRYHIRSRHPGDALASPGAELDHTTIPAFGPRTGERLVLHLFRKLRSGQRRGVPYLAPVIEPLKQLDRYSEAELMAAVVSSFFTVFVKTESGEGIGDLEGAPVGAAGEINLGPGAVVDLAPGEDVQFANPSRPSAQFDPFWLAIVRQIGVALGIPYEILIQHFSSSYSASRAALETAWQHFRVRRDWLASSFCQPVYEWFVAEAVARGLLAAPGFDDPIRRAAWCAATWIGDARISLDPVKDARGDAIAEAHGWKTAEQITAERTGGDWRRNMQKRAREVEERRKAGLDPVPATPGAAPPGGGGGASDDREEGDTA